MTIKRMGLLLVPAVLICAYVIAQHRKSQRIVFMDVARKVDVGSPLTGYYYDSFSDRMVSYRVPRFARFKRVIFSQPYWGRFELIIQTRAPIPVKTKDRLLIGAYFDTSEREGDWDTGVIFTHGSCTYDDMTPNGWRTLLPPGRAAVIQCLPTESKVVLGKAKASVRGSRVSISFDSALTNQCTKLNYVTIYYLPGDVDINRVSGGICQCLADIAVTNQEAPPGAQFPAPF